MKRMWWLTIFLILVMGGAAFAGGLTYYGTVKKHDGGTAAAGYAAEVWDGAVTTHPTAPNYNSASGSMAPSPPNTITTNGSGQLGPSGTGDNNFYDPRSNKSCKIRVWEGASPATVIGAQGYYGYGTYSIGGESAPPAEKPETITTDYRASAPDAPGVAASGFNLTWDDTREQFLVAFTLTASAGTGWKSEAVTYQIRVKKPGGKWYDTHDGAVWNIVETNPEDPYFVGGGNYVAQAIATNPFGTTEGPEQPFLIPTGGVQGPDSATYNLIKLDAGLGVNTFPIAYAEVLDPSIATVKDLVEAINAQAGSTIVTAIGWWNANTQLPEGYIVNIDFDSGNITGYEGTKDLAAPESVALEKDKVYQVSVLQNATFSITGLRVR